jgi:RNA polymerase sigma factor (TIGR02999 family)
MPLPATGVFVSDVTQIFAAIDDGDARAADQLFPLVYVELRSLAASLLDAEKPGQTLQATALVHEAWLRLVGSNSTNSTTSRSQFFAAAAEAMRRILVESARRKTALKRGGGNGRVELAEEMLAISRPQEAIAVDDALDALAEQYPLAADLVKLHYYAGFSLEEAAELLGISRASGYRAWTYARTWLKACLKDHR